MDLKSYIDNVKQEKGVDTKDIKEALALSVMILIQEIKDATIFSSKKELKAISMLQTDPIFSEMLIPYIENKKFLKDKYAKKIIRVLQDIAKALGNIEATEKEGFLRGIFGKNNNRM